MYYCECIDFASGELIGVAFDEENPCQAGTHCGGCPGQTIHNPLYVDCSPIAPDDPTTGAAYNCNNWDPDDFINSPSSNTYTVDAFLVTSVQADFTPLYQCDSARINVDDGKLVVEDAVSTDMVYLLGLRNGDELVEVNGMPVTDALEAYLAYSELWLNQGETSYTLKVVRNQADLYLSYSILFTSP